MTEHPIAQPVHSIVIFDNQRALEAYTVGEKGVTRIDAVEKSGMHANIPYLRVWKGDLCHSEFCQHQIVGVYFNEARP